MEPELVPVTLEQLDVDVVKGHLDGNGTVIFKSGAVYEGDWKDGCMHGNGKLLFPDCLAYEGSFLQNVIIGTGVYRWPNGARYEGSVLEGKRHGWGKMSFKNSPVVYEGEWRGGVRHGNGTIYLNKEGTEWYKGEWYNDMKQGWGTMHYANSDVYEGQWQSDLKCGQGVMHWHSRQQQYEGQWLRNLPNGVGTQTWFRQVSEPTAANHALLLMYNRYYGNFLDGQRSGYGVLFYATGARYEGQWLADKKQGRGCFVFENGFVWTGQFEVDRPVLGEGEQFAPPSTNIMMAIDDLLDEEESSIASSRGVSNVLMCYNSDLRSLYDKYCKRPTLHMPPNYKRPSFTLLTAQFWELMSDAHITSSSTPLHKADKLLLHARRPAAALDGFRQQMHQQLGVQDNPADVAYWESLLEESRQGGPHNPLQELLFPAFCEGLVRVAAVRYRHLPGLERRLHTLINHHLLHLISKAKAVSAPPRDPFHAELWSSEQAINLMHELQPRLQQVFIHLTNQASTGGSNQEDDVPPQNAYAAESTPRETLGLLSQLGVAKDAAAKLQAAAALCHNYLSANTYGPSQRLRIEGEGCDGDQDVEGSTFACHLDDMDEHEIEAWLGMPLTYADFVDGLMRLAHRWIGFGVQGFGFEGPDGQIKAWLGMPVRHSAGGSPLHDKLSEWFEGSNGLLGAFAKLVLVANS